MVEELNQNFGIGEELVFSRHESGLVQGVVQTAACTGSFYLLGAHVAGFRPAGQSHDVLFMSSQAIFEVGKPIRGGVPICFPWFGPHKTDPHAPAHGCARTAEWKVTSSQLQADCVAVTLGLVVDAFELAYTMSFGKELGLSLIIRNLAQVAQPCEIALHTYFLVSDASRVRISGLESLGYLDQLSKQDHSATGTPIVFTEETDRIYRGKVDNITIGDSGFARQIMIRPSHSRSTVVWNPWIAKSQRLNDFGDREYLEMCCVETANTAPDQMQIGPGEQQSIALTIDVHSMESI